MDQQELTPAEERVYREILLGQSNKEVAYRLGINEKTVKFHLYNIFRKFQVDSCRQLLARALGTYYRDGLLIKGKGDGCGQKENKKDSCGD